MPVTFDEHRATFDFPNGSHLMLEADAERLRFTLDVPTGEDADRMKEVVTSHLDRFAFREAPLAFVQE